MTSQQITDSCLRLVDRVGLLTLANGSNFVFSPLSVRAALSLAAVGSTGETLNQFLSFLGSPTVGDLNSNAARLLSSVRSARSDDIGGSRLSFANGIWVDRSCPLKGSFQEIANSIYDAVAESVDFQNEAPKIAVEVNSWVEKVTNGLIKDLLPKDSVDHSTGLILANALYFRGIWIEKFDKSKTINKEFHLLDKNTVQVPFMTSKEDQFLSSYDGFKVLKLPYLKDQQSRNFSLLIFLPDKIDGISDLLTVATADPNFFDLHVPKHKVGVGNFMIPKFRISTGFEATKFLKALGLELPFDKQADFTEMVLAVSPGLFISNVHHKAAIEVEEEGTTAAATTVVTWKKFCCYVEPENFVADHPFMFAIREDETGALLFLGHVANPLVAETYL